MKELRTLYVAVILLWLILFRSKYPLSWMQFSFKIEADKLFGDVIAIWF